MKFSVSVFDLMNSEAKQKVIRFLLGHDASMSEREIASVVGVSHMTVNRILQELAQMNAVSYSVVGNSHVWKVNERSYVYQALKKIFDDINGILSPAAEFERLVSATLPKHLVKQAVLFGSMAEKTEKPDSDIDVFLLVSNADDKKQMEEAVEVLSIKCLEVFGNRLAPYILTEREYRDKKDLKIMEAIRRGVQIHIN